MPPWLVPVVFSCDIAQWATMFDRQVITMYLSSIPAKVIVHSFDLFGPYMEKTKKISFCFLTIILHFISSPTKMTLSNCELYCNIEWHYIAIQSGKNAACGGQLAPATTLHTSIWSQCHYPVASSASKGVNNILRYFRNMQRRCLLPPSPYWKRHLNTSESIDLVKRFNTVSFG